MILTYEISKLVRRANFLSIKYTIINQLLHEIKELKSNRTNRALIKNQPNYRNNLMRWLRMWLDGGGLPRRLYWFADGVMILSWCAWIFTIISIGLPARPAAVLLPSCLGAALLRVFLNFGQYFVLTFGSAPKSPSSLPSRGHCFCLPASSRSKRSSTFINLGVRGRSDDSPTRRLQSFARPPAKFFLGAHREIFGEKRSPCVLDQ